MLDWCYVFKWWLTVQTGGSPLDSASVRGLLTVVELLIGAGANVNVQTEVSVCTLQQSFTRVQISSLRLDSLTLICIISEGVSSKHWLTKIQRIRRSQEPSTHILLMQSICVFRMSLLLTRSVQGGATALHNAANKGHLRVVKMLMEANADVNIKNYVRTYI